MLPVLSIFVMSLSGVKLLILSPISIVLFGIIYLGKLNPVCFQTQVDLSSSIEISGKLRERDVTIAFFGMK